MFLKFEVKVKKEQKVGWKIYIEVMSNEQGPGSS
jgi:hypothetical protein